MYHICYVYFSNSLQIKVKKKVMRPKSRRLECTGSAGSQGLCPIHSGCLPFETCSLLLSADGPWVVNHDHMDPTGLPQHSLKHLLEPAQAWHQPMIASIHIRTPLLQMCPCVSLYWAPNLEEKKNADFSIQRGPIEHVLEVQWCFSVPYGNQRGARASDAQSHKSLCNK